MKVPCEKNLRCEYCLTPLMGKKFYSIIRNAFFCDCFCWQDYEEERKRINAAKKQQEAATPPKA